MNLSLRRVLVWTLALVAAAFTGRAFAVDVALDRVAILSDPDQPSYVKYAVEDLVGYLKDLSAAPAQVDSPSAYKSPCLIAIGSKSAEHAIGKPLDTSGLGEEGYLLRSKDQDGRSILIAAGATPRGTKAAVGALIKRIDASGKTPAIKTPLDIRSKPSFAKRGMHFNGWPFGYPYTFRGWSERDWQRYLDILAYEGVNLFYLWPFMEIMPLPLPPEDQAYLEECRRVVDYAHEKHGMEVWIMHCTNRVAQDRCGVADPKKRPYWRPSQKDLNPGDPKDFQAIMDSRAALYKALNNADGFCNIDSDPGYYVGSPLEDYIKILKGCRELLDKHTLGGKQTKLIDWMWIGWGIKHIPFTRNPEHQDRTIGLLKQELPEAWSLLSGDFKYLPACRKHGVIGKTILLQYGMIELEPAYPHTNVAIDSLRRMMDDYFAPNTDLLGLMGNMQTPLLQFPHMHYYASSMWNLDYRKLPEREVLLETAGLLYPEHCDLIANAFQGLNDPNAARVAALADKLDELVRTDRLGRLGPFGRKLFPDGRIVAQSLVFQLRLRAATERLMQVSGDTSADDCATAVRDCLDASIAWGEANGWPALWGQRKPALESIAGDPRFVDLPSQLALCLKTQAAVDVCFEKVIVELSKKYDPAIVKGRGAQRLGQQTAQALQNLALSATLDAISGAPSNKANLAVLNDGRRSTTYSTPATASKGEVIQFTWDSAQSIKKVVIFLSQDPAPESHEIRLQRETSDGEWEDCAIAKVANQNASARRELVVELPAPLSVKRLRVIGLSDAAEVSIY